MTIKIEPATPGDAGEMVPVGEAAFADDLLSNKVFPATSATAEETAEHRQYRIDLTKHRMAGAGKHYFKAVDESTGAIVGYVGMFGPDVDVKAQCSISRPACVNVQVYNELSTILDATKKETLGDRQDVWYVQSMAVHPDYQGQGIARRLLERALQGADQAGQDVYLEGTEAGERLYRRCGFEDIRDIAVFDGAYRLKVMIRRPKCVSDNAS